MGREADRPTVGERLSAVAAMLGLVAAVGLALLGIAVHLMAMQIQAGERDRAGLVLPG